MIILKHIYCTDVAFRIKKSLHLPNGDYIWKGEWLNIVNPKNIHYIWDDKFVVKAKDRENWKYYEI